MLTGFSDPRRTILATVFEAPGFDGVIRPETITDVLAADGPPLTLDALMVGLLPVATVYAVVPTSGFAVGAIAEGVGGALYFGANLESGGQALAFTMHAEQSTVCRALAAEETGIRRLAVTAPPCGHCRQFLADLAGAARLQILVPGCAPVALATLLPAAFGPRDLGVVGALLAHAGWVFDEPSVGRDPLRTRALGAARRSYAPYTRSPSAVALGVRDGRVFAAPYVENAGYNPSVSPAIAALDGVRFAGLGAADVDAVHLVEAAGARISQCAFVSGFVEAAMPGARFGVDRLPARAADAP